MTLDLINSRPFHGGDVLSASTETGIPVEDWIDLSTGISPYAYPCKALPVAAFSRLPYIDHRFKDSVRSYYDSEHFVTVAGTQAAIQALPKLLENLPILLPSVGYQEHALAWQSSGNRLDYYHALDEKTAAEEIANKLKAEPGQHLLIINPNNPSTLRFSPQQLSTWAKHLSKRAYLIVDEAFIDSTPSESVIPYLTGPDKPNDNIIVLRSFGKFFGLAGLRLGFVFAEQSLLKRFEAELPLWSVNGPALYLAKRALSDRDWQTAHHETLLKSQALTTALFNPLSSDAYLHERLFSSYLLPKKWALTIFYHFYKKGILLRLIEVSDEQSIIRIGRIKVEDLSGQEKIRVTLAKLVARQRSAG